MQTTSGPWRKLLWVKQPFPDNYVDPSFLSQLRRNSSVETYSMMTLVHASSVAMLHLTSVVLFLTAFVGIYTEDWDPMLISGISVGVTIVCFCLRLYVEGGDHLLNEHDTPSIVKSSALIVFAILAMSPILKSLTQSTSSDSIWSISCWLLLGNICFHDYSYYSREHTKTTTSSSSSVSTKDRFRGMPSTNMAMSSAIVLASRLDSTMSVFWFVLFSVQIFSVWPTFQRWLRDREQYNGRLTATSQKGAKGYIKDNINSTNKTERFDKASIPTICPKAQSFKAHWALLGTHIAFSNLCVGYMFGIWALCLWTVVQVAVMVVFPGWFLALQKYKNEIRGPWDPAKPIIRSQK